MWTQINPVSVGCARAYFIRSNLSTAPLWRAVTVHLDPGASSTHVRLPKLLANTLLVYRLEILTMAGSCKGKPSVDKKL